MNDDRERIEGWKAIAAYLGKSVRTAQQWSITRGLPIRKTGGGVVALKSELDQWVSGIGADEDAGTAEPDVPPKSTPTKRSNLLWLASGAILAALVSAGSFWATHRLGKPVSFRVRGSLLQTLDARDHVLWEHPFPGIAQVEYSDQPSGDDWFGQRGVFADLNGDGKRELLFVYYPPPDHESTLFCFRDDGAVLWSIKPGRKLTTESGLTVYPSYRTSGLAVLQHPRPDGGLIVVASHHSYGWLEHVAILDARGRVCSEYWHPGYFAKLIVGNFGPEGREEIALGGVNNGFREIGFGPTVVLLDPGSASGQGAEPDTDTGHRLVGIPRAQEAAVILFPDLVRDLPEHPLGFNYVRDVELSAEFLHVGITGLETIHYDFDRHLNLRGFVIDQATERWVAHGPLLLRQAAIKNAVTGIRVLRNRFADARM